MPTLPRPPAPRRSRRTPFAWAPLALALLPLAATAAPTPAAASRIERVTVYPGSATVERVAHVAAGSRTLVLGCLPAGLDAQSLQVTADAGIRIGETSVRTEPRALAAECGDSALDAQIRTLQDRQAALEAEHDALGLVTGYLKGLAGGGEGARTPADAARLVAVTDAMRRSGQGALQQQHTLARQQEDLARELAPLLAERERAQGGKAAQVSRVRITLSAAQGGSVRLAYQVAGPGWTPAYRAALDTGSRQLRIKRLALVAQATGEDWNGVKLSLATGAPRRATSGRTPTPWRIGIAQPDRDQHAADVAAPALMAPAPMASRQEKAPEAPLFDVSELQHAFATEFKVPQPIDLPSSGQRVSLLLGQHETRARLAVRTSPRVDGAAYLMAELDAPTGVWPAGKLQLVRDGDYVGQGQWRMPDSGPLTLSFGRDELVAVRAEPEQDSQGSGGLIGQRAERRVQRAYTVENRHRTPIEVQLLEAAPVSVDERVRVDAAFSPQPAETAWQQQPGVALWRLPLAAGQSARVTADYRIGYPKDARLQPR